LDNAKSKKTPPAKPASRAEIDQAFAALSLADQRRLEMAAKYFVRGLGRKVKERSWEDLLQDACLSVIKGTSGTGEGRRWPKGEVPFVTFLGKVMQSIASHWKEAWDENEAALESDILIMLEGGESRSPLSNVPSQVPSQEQAFSGKERLEKALSLFVGDSEASLIIEAWGLGMTGPEIQEQFGLSEERYEAGRKRIRYQVKAAV
jgi:DNA-directed RNA polymerase specialized sigma24 family protein